MRVYNIHKHNANNIITIWLLVMTFGNIVLSYKNRYLCFCKHEFFAHIFIFFFFRLFFHFAYIAFQVKRAIFAVVLPYLSVQMKTWYVHKIKKEKGRFSIHTPFFPLFTFHFSVLYYWLQMQIFYTLHYI